MLLEQLVDWRRQQPDGPNPFGLANRFFLDARDAMRTKEYQEVDAARC